MVNLKALNLPRKMTEEDLSELFKRYGKVNSCSLVLDKVKGTSKGFGFLTMANLDEAEVAVAELHDKRISGNKIRVKLSGGEEVEGVEENAGDQE